MTRTQKKDIKARLSNEEFKFFAIIYTLEEVHNANLHFLEMVWSVDL